MDSQEFRRFGYEMVDWVADYMAEVEKYPVKSPVRPGQISDALPKQPPEEGEPMDRIMADFQSILMPGITHWQHPSFFAYFPANNSPPSVLAEILTAGIGAQCMVWETSPAATELEEVVMEWLRQMLGLPQGMAGVIQDTASTATLCALLTARELRTGFQFNEVGAGEPLTVYASEETHSSIEKAAKIAGYGRRHLRYIPTDESLAMIPEELDRAISEDLRKGLKPACVVATLGSTSSMAMDPLEAVGKVAASHGLWLHVDAAFAGSAAILDEEREMLRGIEHVDSFVFNPHKWLLTNFDCSAYFVRDPGLLVRTFEINPEYLKTGADAQVKNFRDWGLQLGRRFRALKLWFVIRHYGIKGLQEVLRDHIRLAELWARWVQADKRFDLAAPVNLSLVCFRLTGDSGDPEETDRLNESLLNRVNASGRAYLTHTRIRGRYVLRMAIGQRSTEERHVRQAWRLISEAADDLMG